MELNYSYSSLFQSVIYVQQLTMCPVYMAGFWPSSNFAYLWSEAKHIWQKNLIGLNNSKRSMI